MKQTLSDYDKKCIKWLLAEKYNFSQLDIDLFFKNSDIQNVQGWILAKASTKPSLSKEQIKDINKVLSGEPVDYVIGFKDFLGCKIDLSLKPLIPRVETEYWVDEAINEIYKKQDTKFEKQTKILDIFCGSGCIGIAALKHIKNSHVTFADVSEGCINQVKINLEKNKFQKTRYKLMESDVFEKIDGKYDVIFANPPYVEDRYVQMSKDLYFEPKIALLGGKNGMVYIDKFLSSASGFVKGGGVIYMEFGDNQEKLVEGIVKKYNYKNYEIKKDQFGKLRYLKIDM